VEAKTKLDKAEDLALDGLISKEKLQATRSAAIATIQAANDELSHLLEQANMPSRPSKQWLKEVGSSLRELTELLLAEELTVDDKLDALRRIGLVRLYIDGPRVQVCLAS
jgi:hypothetical protein